MNDETEILDLVDEHDRVIGQIARSEFYAVPRSKNNIRVVNGFVRNKEGQLWIPRRTEHKKVFPGAYDFSVAGHVTSGESYEEALAHEVIEELNIDMSKVAFKEIGYFKDGEHGLHCFMKVYEIRSDETPEFNKDDFSEGVWWSPQEAWDILATEQNLKDDLPKLIKLLYL